MTGRRPPAHRGVALLLVLGALVLVVIVIAGAARIAAVDHARTTRLQELQQVDALLPAAEEIITHWLEESAGTIVLSEDVIEPRIEVVHDAWQIGGQVYSIRVTAWDQRGLLPISQLRRGSPLRTVVPIPVVQIIDSFSSEEGPITGLDQFTMNGAKLRAFPIGEAGAPVWFGDGVAAKPLPEDHSANENRGTIGAFITPHHGDDSFLLNVNTAPITLLEAALREAGRGGIEAIIAARRAGKPASVPSTSKNASSNQREQPQFTGTTDCWAFRINLTIDRATRSWWEVYQRVPKPPRGASPWFRVQRLLITEPTR